MTVKGDPEWGPAVHTRTDRELGPDGHLAAPIDARLMATAGAQPETPES
jgi:hypothetical protein